MSQSNDGDDGDDGDGDDDDDDDVNDDDVDDEGIPFRIKLVLLLCVYKTFKPTKQTLKKSNIFCDYGTVYNATDVPNGDDVTCRKSHSCTSPILVFAYSILMPPFSAEDCMIRL